MASFSSAREKSCLFFGLNSTISPLDLIIKDFISQEYTQAAWDKQGIIFHFFFNALSTADAGLGPLFAPERTLSVRPPGRGRRALARRAARAAAVIVFLWPLPSWPSRLASVEASNVFIGTHKVRPKAL